MTASKNALLTVRELTVALPDGTIVVDKIDLEVVAGRVVSLLGPSGVGKSTLVRAVLDPDDLRRRGFTVTWAERELAAPPAFVPQRGALLDYLDVAANITLAQTANKTRPEAEAWLAAVDLDPALAERGRSVSSLSGGQAQRVAVARTLAAGRKIVILDEPSVGLDPLGVRQLARLLVKQARDHDAAIVLITHDIALAAGASHAIYFLDPQERSLDHVMRAWDGPAENETAEKRRERIAALEAEVEALLLRERPRAGRGKRARARWAVFRPLVVAGDAMLRFFQPRLLRESAVVMRRALVQALLRPLAFYAIVGLLLGFTVPYVIVHISSALKPSAVLGLIGGSYILSLAPPLSAIVFSATSGSAINAWLGGLRLHGQVLALEGLGVAPARYLWSPAWVALAFSYVVTLAVFVLAMTCGGLALYDLYGVPHAFAKLTADFVDPPPSRVAFLVRGAWLAFAYAIAVASIVVAKGSEPKERSEEVTSAMTSSVMRTTLFVVMMELVSVGVLFWLASKGAK